MDFLASHWDEIAGAAALVYGYLTRRRLKAILGDPEKYEAARRKAGLTDEGGGSRAGKEARAEWERDQKRGGK